MIRGGPWENLKPAGRRYRSVFPPRTAPYVAGRKGSVHKSGAKTTKRNKAQGDAAPPKKQADPLRIARPLAVRLLGVSDRTFARLESEGVIAPLAAGTGRSHSVYDAPAIVAAYLARQERQLTGSNLSPRDRRDRSQAELNELRLARERGELLPREQVVQEGQAYIRATMAKLRQLASRMAREGIVSPSAEERVGKLVQEATSEMARWRTIVDLQRVVEGAA